MINIENLTKLAVYLESLPDGYEDFGMRSYLFARDAKQLENYALKNGGVHTCGTAACAIGHGPSAGILFPAPEPNSILWDYGHHLVYPDGPNGRSQLVHGYTPDWNEYSKEFFIDEDNAREWDWCFGGNWSYADDSHQGAAARIRYMLEHGVPMDFDDDGDANENMVELYESFLK